MTTAIDRFQNAQCSIVTYIGGIFNLSGFPTINNQ
jgi:hypothetical protein